MFVRSTELNLKAPYVLYVGLSITDSAVDKNAQIADVNIFLCIIINPLLVLLGVFLNLLGECILNLSI